MQIKKKKHIKKLFYIFIIFVIAMQISLIAHRNSFNFKFFLKFHSKDIGLKDGLKNKKIFDIVTLIKRNNLNYYNLASDLFNFSNKLNKIHHKLYQRVIEASYPSKINQESKTIISSNKSKFSMCKQEDKQGSIYVFKC